MCDLYIIPRGDTAHIGKNYLIKIYRSASPSTNRTEKNGTFSKSNYDNLYSRVFNEITCQLHVYSVSSLT